jgi:hypothetical protein
LLQNQVLSSARFHEHFPGTPPWNTDLHPLLEYRAPQAFFVGDRARLLRQLDERKLPPAEARTHLADAVRAGLIQGVPTPQLEDDQE